MILNFDFNGSVLMIRYTLWAMEKSLFLITPHSYSIDPDKNCLGRIVVASSDASLESITNNNHNLAVEYLNVVAYVAYVEPDTDRAPTIAMDMRNDEELSTGQT